MEKSLDFSFNWNNKLYTDYFTTLRLSGRFEVGDKVEVFLNKTCLGVVEIIDKRATFLDKISDWMAMLDTGYNAEQTRGILQKMYPAVTNWGTRPIFYYLCHFTTRLPNLPTKPAPVPKVDLFTTQVAQDEKI
jgi:hypothetical protein